MSSKTNMRVQAMGMRSVADGSLEPARNLIW
jgi:hypothetical protein